MATRQQLSCRQTWVMVVNVFGGRGPGGRHLGAMVSDIVMLKLQWSVTSCVCTYVVCSAMAGTYGWIAMLP